MYHLMAKKRINIQIDENNHRYLQKIRREIMIENYHHIKISRPIELALIELRKNNTDQEIKEKIMHFDRLGNDGREELIKQL